jgi:hypothetical protein
VGAHQEAPGAARRVADGLLGTGAHDVHDPGYELAGGEVLARALGGLCGRAGEDALVDVALDVGLHRGPVFLVYKVHYETPEQGGVLSPGAPA